MANLYLISAVVAEVIVSSAIKASGEFTKIVPSTLVAFGYLVAFYLITLVLQTLAIGITYAIWSGLGIVLVTIVSML